MAMRKLMPHQFQMLKYASERSRIALFCEMRLGKTLVAIRWLQKQEAKRILVLCPKSVIPSWQGELQKEGYAKSRVVVLQGTGEERLVLAEKGIQWNLMNYEGILCSPEIVAVQWDAIILDESTRIRNPQAQVTKLLRHHSSSVRFKAILTGYPCPESALDYVEQLRFLWDGRLMGTNDYWTWRNRYCTQIGYNWQIRSHGEKQLKELLTTEAYILTRKEAGIGSKKIYETRTVEMTLQQDKLYTQLKKDFEYSFRKEIKETKWIPVKLNWLAQIASGFTPEGQRLSEEKFKVIRELLEGELRGEKVVIWFRGNAEVTYVREALIKMNIKTGIFTGEFKLGLNPDGTLQKDIQVMCAQGKCGMMGLDWSSASTAIYFSNWWDGEIRTQSEDRIIHPQKKEPVLYIDLICKDTIDEHILELLQKKSLTAKKFLYELVRKVFK